MGGDAAYAFDRFERPDRNLEPPTDRARFEEMLNRHHRRLRRVVGGVIADPDRVDDVLQASLGNLIADVTFTGGLGLNGYRQLGWWTWAFPGAALALLLICVNLVGDELDAALNPAARNRA